MLKFKSIMASDICMTYQSLMDICPTLHELSDTLMLVSTIYIIMIMNKPVKIDHIGMNCMHIIIKIKILLSRILYNNIYVSCKMLLIKSFIDDRRFMLIP